MNALAIPHFNILTFPRGGASQLLERVKRMGQLNHFGGAASLEAMAAGGVFASSNWWEAGGATGCVAAYQPKGAASLAASYVNLANPGTYDAAPGVAPTLSGGWVFNGSTQYLDSGMNVPSSLTWSIFVQYSGAGYGTENTIVGGHYAIGNQGSVYIIIASDNSMVIANGHQGGPAANAPALLAGNYALVGRTGYRNGVADSSLVFNLGGSASPGIYIGAKAENGSVDSFFTGTIQALAIYDNTLTSGQIAAVVAAMAAL